MSRLKEAGSPYHHGQLREALLDAAFELLGTQNVNQISLREIARQAGVSHAAPYHYFPDRAQLLGALAEKCNALFYTAQEKAVQAQSSPTERLMALGQAYVHFATAHPNAFSLIFDPEICPPNGSDTSAATSVQANHELLGRVIHDCQAAGYFPGHDSAVVGAALWATVHGLAHLILLGHLPEGVVPDALRTLTATLGEQP
ncbi:TetR/AcrR family transcriptional regulator [Deinococcus saxicola]|uniref:TetR/AcrR family transcriptional regulator n=1 Tax=Deinococcus saxicola TaxID=249406 RepID=UPI0039EF803A